ncbi:hypothetical protein COBT_003376, partial [Conglomerata obtusa]
MMEKESRNYRARSYAHQSNEFLLLINGSNITERAPAVFRRFKKDKVHLINDNQNQMVEQSMPKNKIDMNALNGSQSSTVCPLQILGSSSQMNKQEKTIEQFQIAYSYNLCQKIPLLHSNFVIYCVIKGLFAAHMNATSFGTQKSKKNSNFAKTEKFQNTNLADVKKNYLPNLYKFNIKKFKHKYIIQSAKEFLEGQIKFVLRLIIFYLDDLASKMILKDLNYYFCSDCMRQKRNKGFEIEEGVIFLILELYEILKENNYISIGFILNMKDKKQYFFESSRGYVLLIDLEQNKKFKSGCVCDKPWVYRILSFFGCYDK